MKKVKYFYPLQTIGQIDEFCMLHNRSVVFDKKTKEVLNTTEFDYRVKLNLELIDKFNRITEEHKRYNEFMKGCEK